MHYMKDVGGIIPIAARIADAYRDIFQNHKSIFVLERLMRDKRGLTVPSQYSQSYPYIVVTYNLDYS